jgi:hypothetical protein
MALPMSTESLIAQAVKRSSYGPSRDAPVVLPEAVVDFVEVDPDDGTAIHITRDQWRLLTAVDGVSPLWAIANTLQAPEHLIVRLAGELIGRGTVMVVGRAHRR